MGQSLEAHQQRVVDELEELSAKITALDAFIRTNPIYEALPHEERWDLTAQLRWMRGYADSLMRRIHRWSA
jgi:hypothetical protein